jgi:urate oxidase
VTHHAHITKAFIDILSHKWSRIPVNGKPHGWAFTRDGEEKGVIGVMADATSGKQNVKATVNVGLKDLLGKPSGKSTSSRSPSRTDREFNLSLKDRWFEFRGLLQG